jgi:hypothetical protein
MLWLPLKVKPLLHMQAALLLMLTLTMPRRHKLRVIAAFAGADAGIADDDEKLLQSLKC